MDTAIAAIQVFMLAHPYVHATLGVLTYIFGWGHGKGLWSKKDTPVYRDPVDFQR